MKLPKRFQDLGFVFLLATATLGLSLNNDKGTHIDPSNIRAYTKFDRPNNDMQDAEVKRESLVEPVLK